MTSEHGPRTHPPSPTAEDEVGTHFKYTISPGVETLVRLKSLPDAVCRVRFDEDGASPFTIISSSAGYIDLYATCTEEAESRRVIVEASNTASAVEQAIDLRCSTQPTHDMPNSAPDPWPSSPLDRSLPALSEQEAVDEHASQLTARGYPPRPDPDAVPSAYRSWHRLVTQPLTVVAPSHIANPDYTRRRRVEGGQGQAQIIRPDDIQLANWDNWCGAELWFDDGRTFVLVEAMWVTPSVSLYSALSGTATASLWVGLDGSPGLPLLQGGVDHNATNSGAHTVTSYQAWSEMWPNQPGSININNLPIAPNDEIVCTAAVVNNNGTPTAPATKGQIHVSNITKQTIGVAAPPLDPSFNIGSRHAIWILERLEVNNNYRLLAQFPDILVTNAFAEPADQSQPLMPVWTPNSTDPALTTVIDVMTDSASNNTLAHATLVSNSEIQIKWYRYS